MDEINVSYNFEQGFVQNRNVIRVISRLDEFTNHGSQSSSLMMWSQNKKQWFQFNLGWTAIRIACSESQMFVLGSDGHILKADASGMAEEDIKSSDNSLITVKDFKDMRLIGDQLYVVGDEHQIYIRQGSNNWIKSDVGHKSSRHDHKECGLNAIYGLDESEIYAVGDNGEIWHCNAGKWSELDSPTSVTLNCIRVIEPGLAYATGNEGTLLRGHGNLWEVVNQNTTKEDLFGIEWFDEKLYIASEGELFVLRDDNQLERAGAGYGPGWTFKHLHANDGILWSFGKDHLFSTEDGKRWHNVTPHTDTFDPSDSGPAAGKSSCGCGCSTGSAHKCD
ncbi:MAG: hypothetical protein GY847_13395 [Proteobacteria bacterium]|nr:hypothetical protein [Pseudomonadota bacterium]